MSGSESSESEFDHTEDAIRQIAAYSGEPLVRQYYITSIIYLLQMKALAKWFSCYFTDFEIVVHSYKQKFRDKNYRMEEHPIYTTLFSNIQFTVCYNFRIVTA